MLFNLFLKIKAHFRKANLKAKKTNKWTLKRPNLLTNLLHIKNHNESYKGAPLSLSILNRHANISNRTIGNFLPRFESPSKVNFYGSNTCQGRVITNLVNSLSNLKFTLRFRKLSLLHIQDTVLSYRSWRHFKGLPVRGQRTWTNKTTVRSTNTDMRNLKFQIMKRYYGNFNTSAVSVGTTVEAYNRLWYKQWFHEWWSTRLRRLRLGKNSNKVCVYDFNSVTSGRVVGYQRQAKPGKKKRVYKNNYFTIGFVSGYTKRLISAALKKPEGSTVRIGRSSLAQVLLSAPREKKKVSKKVSLAKKKQDKLTKLKKKKEVLKNKSSELRRIRDQKTKNLKKAQR